MTQLADQCGNPLNAITLLTQQTARSVFLKREFNEHLSRGLTPARLVSILEEAEQGNLFVGTS